MSIVNDTCQVVITADMEHIYKALASAQAVANKYGLLLTFKAFPLLNTEALEDPSISTEEKVKAMKEVIGSLAEVLKPADKHEDKADD